MSRTRTKNRHLAAVFACFVLLLAGAFLLAACKKETPAIAAELPVVRDETLGLSFTYVDEKGNPHVVDTVAEVPGAQAQKVRVMDPAHAPPEDMMYLADFSKRKLDGSYAVSVAPRQDFESYIVERRKATGPIADVGSPRVIIYGAEWCGACHQAAAWLKGKNVNFVEKDIEKDSGAEREMRAKLAKAGLSGGSIPVIDVGGKIMVGFSPPKIQAALGDAI